MRLRSIYEWENPDAAIRILYALLQEREPRESISHKAMPTFDQHRAFVETRPYENWYFMCKSEERPSHPVMDTVVGSAYLTRQREVGLFVFRQYRRRGFGRAALLEMRARHPGPLYANVNPANQWSVEFFLRQGARLVQNTYEL